METLDTVSKKSRHANEPVPIEDFMSDDSSSSGDEYFYDEEWLSSVPLESNWFYVDINTLCYVFIGYVI